MPLVSLNSQIKYLHSIDCVWKFRVENFGYVKHDPNERNNVSFNHPPPTATLLTGILGRWIIHTYPSNNLRSICSMSDDWLWRNGCRIGLALLAYKLDNGWRLENVGINVSRIDDRFSFPSNRDCSTFDPSLVSLERKETSIPQRSYPNKQNFGVDRVDSGSVPRN